MPKKPVVPPPPSLRLGRLAPYPESVKPRLKLGTYLKAPLPIPPDAVTATKTSEDSLAANMAAASVTPPPRPAETPAAAAPATPTAMPMAAPAK